MEDMNTQELPQQHETTGDAQQQPFTDILQRNVTRGQFLKGMAAVAVGAALGKDILGATGARAAGTTEVSQVPVSIALPEIPPMSADALKSTEPVGLNNNFLKPFQTTLNGWTPDQQAAYPQDEMDTANWLDAIYMQAQNIATVTGNTQMFDTINTLREYERKYLVDNRFIFVIYNKPPWDYTDPDTNPQKQYGAFTASVVSTSNDQRVLVELNIRSSARSKDYNAPNKTQSLHDTMYFGEIIKIDKLNVDAASDPLDANTIKSSLASKVSNVIIETEAYQRTISTMQQIQPSFGQLGIVYNFSNDARTFIQNFTAIDSQGLSPDDATYQKRLLVNGRTNTPVAGQDLQKLADPNNNGLILK